MKNEQQLMTWKVSFEDIDFLGTMERSTGSSVFHSGSSGSTESLEKTLINKNPHSAIRIAHYKGALVVVKSAQVTSILPYDEEEMNAMRSFNEENVNEFIGLCTDPGNFCVLTARCSKGSLQDVLSNEEIKFDHTFKNSFIFDVLSGLSFLHRSLVKSHGRLKTSNCLVSPRWTIKLTDYGLHNIRCNKIYETDYEQYSALLWTAPEILRSPFPPVNGTSKGDVYSFGILMHNILFRSAPFQAELGKERVTPYVIVKRVRNGETPPFRPEIPELDKQATNPGLIALMKQCWTDDSVTRPNITTVISKFNAINNGKRYNIMDNMLQMMEDYTNNLESTVKLRSQALMEEKAKIDQLLYNMLPAHMADSLKAGVRLKPELFHEASVYFSDICGFVDLLSELSPIEIVSVLGKLWDEFDETIARHNVYKVETIGDSYMVASGVPVINLSHASDIADMALDILETTKSMELDINRSLRNTSGDFEDDFILDSNVAGSLGIRIGINSGPVVGAVVGLTMPRYCLFGDTVNLASRIETTGLPYRIHISERTYYTLMNSGSKFDFTKRGEMQIKGKGMQTTYWLHGRRLD